MLFTVDHLKFFYDQNAWVLDGVNFEVPKGGIFCILGPSGCGKTTLFKLLAGILEPTEGVIGKGFAQPKSFLFQEPRLLSHLTVMENLRLTTPKKAAADTQIADLLDAVGLKGYESHFPDELSGGMQQRLAAVRAFLFPADLMFLDEPFKSLDFRTKLDLVNAFKALYTKRAKTVLMITHDALDAALLADQVVVLSEKPTRVLRTYSNPVPADMRQPDNPQVGTFLSTLWSEHTMV